LSDTSLKLTAVGDLMLTAAPGETLRVAERLAGVADLLRQADVTLANLECALPGDGETVPTEPRVIALPEQISPLAKLGIDVVSLANNHAFDALKDGFDRLRSHLAELGIGWFGAGDDRSRAAAPALVERNGVRLAILGAADERSGAPFFAQDRRWGVAPWDVDALAEDVSRLREQVHHVLVCPHWGEERFLIPSPQQVAEARTLIDAGASMVIGHHPHVVQGVERYRGGVIAYSLGNFVAGHAGFADGDRIEWNRTERTGLLLRARLTPESIEDVQTVLTFDDGRCVSLAANRSAQRHLARVNRRLARGVTPGHYRREHLRVKTLIPLLQHLRWRELKRLRWRNLQNAWARLRESRKAR
jgi:poly-gamma-glutamate synthesis protein (capsule biosynthesis protein)